MANTAFSHPKYNGRHANLGNTVLVNLGQLCSEGDLWCLGYLQNIESEQALIDLDCAQFPPLWISTQYVWYHHLTDFGSPHQHPHRPPPLSVQVALRNELDGPFIFRAAQLLNRPSYGNLYVCCVTINATEAGRNDVQDIQVVHHWQVVQSLPINEAPLFGRLRQTGNLDEIPVLKQTVYTKKIDTNRTFSQREIRSLVSMAVKRARFRRNAVGLHPRAFVAIGKASIMVLLFDLHLWRVNDNAVGQREWSALSQQAFALEVEEWFGRYKEGLAPEVTMHDSSIRAEVNISHRLTEEAEPLDIIIPWELLSEVLLSLDFHSQLRAKRVSSVWHSLLRTKPAWAAIDLARLGQKTSFFFDASKGHYIGTLLDRAVGQKTKVLGLYNINVDKDKSYDYDDHVRLTEVVRNLLALKQVGLLAIMLKNCRFLFELALTSKLDDFMAHKLRHISRLLPMCQKLFLSNHTVVEIPGCDCGIIHGRITSPRAVAVRFPLLQFHRSAGERESIMCYVKALEPQLPSVDEIKARFKERHQFFEETLPYPDGWQRFRQFLRRHTFTELATLESFWNDLDLRNFDQLPLSKMVLLPLDDCIDIVFENVNV